MTLPRAGSDDARELDRQTTGGKWVKRDADIHRCLYPGYDRRIKVGDQWQCNTCRGIWEVTKIDTGSQWDPISPPVFRWKRVVQEHGIYAPGTK